MILARLLKQLKITVIRKILKNGVQQESPAIYNRLKYCIKKHKFTASTTNKNINTFFVYFHIVYNFYVN